MLEQRTRLIMLYDFYGALLTDIQSTYIKAHYVEDCSLMEIAEEYGVSRQAVHDSLKRAQLLLEDFEAKLKFTERWQRQQEHLRALAVELDKNNLDIAKCQKLLNIVLQEGVE